MSSSLASLTPAQIVSSSDLQISNVDLVKAFTRYEDSGKGFLAMGALRLGKAAFKVLIKGELTTNGVAVNEFNKIANYSLGIQFDESEDLEAFEKFNELLIQFLKSQNQNPEDWDLTNPVKEDRIYVKLKTNQKKSFEIISNIKLDPKKLQESGLYRGQKVEVVAEISVYFNLIDKKAGISVGPRRVTFQQD